MNEQNTWFVVVYPNSASNEGRVLWDTETSSKDYALFQAARLSRLEPLNSDKHFDISDLPNLENVLEEAATICH